MSALLHRVCLLCERRCAGATPVLHFTKVGSAVSSFGTWIEGVEHKTQDFMLDVTFPYEGAGEVEDGPKPKVRAGGAHVAWLLVMFLGAI